MGNTVEIVAKSNSAERKEQFRKRTKSFASCVIRLYVELPRARAEVQVLGRQMLRSATSVAANDREASRARSQAEFVAKAEQCAQEADETILWLELLKEDCGISLGVLDALHKEANELLAIFVTMARNAKRNQ